MARYLVRLQDYRDDKVYYLEWSTVVDAPVCVCDSLEDLVRYYREEHGNLSDIGERLERLLTKGTSALYHDNEEQTVECNSAGQNGECLSMTELLDWCRNTIAG